MTQRAPDETFDLFMEQYDLDRTEGSTGVKNLAILVGHLGYKHHNYYGQFQQTKKDGSSSIGALGDIFTFLEDNSGAIGALQDFIRENCGKEWQETLEAGIEDCGEDDDE